MERLNTYSEKSTQAKDSLKLTGHAQSPQTINEGLQEAENGADDSRVSGEGNLPSLASIGDISLPDFGNQTFESISERDAFQPNDQSSFHEDQPQQTEKVQRAHELYVSQLVKHKPSVRKPPGEDPENEDVKSIDLQTPENDGNKDRDLQTTPKQGLEHTILGPDIAPVMSPESISTKHLSGDFQHMVQPNSAALNRDDLLRRDSTMTTSTFNMGSWKPNTNVYRDRFVNDNDNESQANYNAFDAEDENNYTKFTGMRSASAGYAESFTNSSSLSVPETVALPSINENASDGDDTFDDSLESSQQNRNDSSQGHVDKNASSVSVLKDRRDQDTPTFVEERLSTVGSMEHLRSLDSIETAATKSARNSQRDDHDMSASERATGTGTDKAVPETPDDTQKSNVEASGASAGTRNTSELAGSASVKRSNQKYPVFSFKKIMAISQPIDRIQALQKAKQDEFNYDSGLQYWIQETLKSAEVAPTMQISKLAEEAYLNAQHTDLRRHASMSLNTASLRNKVSLMKDKMDTTAGFGRRFLNKGKKLMKQ